MKINDLKLLIADVDAALKQISEKHGIQKLSCGGVKYESNPSNPTEIVGFRFSCDAQVDSTKSEIYFKAVGLPLDSIGKKFVYKGKSYEIVGAEPKQKYSIHVKSGDKITRFQADDVKRLLGIVTNPVMTITPGTLIKRPVPMPNDIAAKFKSLASQLSPENLTCDGELNKIQVGMKRKKIMNEWKALETSLGRTVSFDEFPY